VIGPTRIVIRGILKSLSQFLLFAVVVPVLLAAPWTLLLFVLTQRFSWQGITVIGAFVSIVYWFELAKERGLVFEAAMTTFVWTIVVAAIGAVVAYLRTR